METIHYSRSRVVVVVSDGHSLNNKVIDDERRGGDEVYAGPVEKWHIKSTSSTAAACRW